MVLVGVLQAGSRGCGGCVCWSSDGGGAVAKCNGGDVGGDVSR